MCGIIGYIGPRPVVPLILDGLRKLEYRGYDSAGIAVVSDGADDDPAQRRQARQPRDGPRRRPAVGRVRHRPHPLGDARPAHRGERAPAPRLHRSDRRRPQRHHRELSRAQARAPVAGPPFVTETDTEVVAHLVEREWQRRRARGRRSPGHDAAAGPVRAGAVSADDPDKIVAVRNGPPVVVGLGDGEYFVASDIPAILAHTRDVVFLGDRRWPWSRAQGAVFSDFDGDAIAKTPDPRHLGPDRRREGRVQALHAQGDLRAAARPCATPSWAASRSRRARSFRDETGLDDALLRAVERGDRSSPAARRGTRRWWASS